MAQGGTRGDHSSVDTEYFGQPLGTWLIPVFAGVIGLFTNWVAIKMMFLPIDWVGWKLPFKVGIGPYKFPVLGWQGVIPSKAAKMGSIAVDTGLSKLGTMYEFFLTFDPHEVATQIVATSGDEIHRIVDDIIEREYPELWRIAPPQVKRMIHQRVENQMPEIVEEVLDNVGKNIERLVDLKLMVIRYLEANPRLINKIFQDVGAKEFSFIVRSGGWMGFILGLGPMAVWIVYPEWWTVPVGAAVVGYLTNFIALKVIFQPLEPTRYGPFKMHGLFLRRQAEVADEYSNIIAYEIVTLKNVARTMLEGPDADRTQRLIADSMRPAVDDAVGAVKPIVRAAGQGRMDAALEGIATEAVHSTMDTLLDEDFGRERAKGMQNLLSTRMRALSYPEFAQMLRSAFEQDEWMLIVVGAFLGFAAGVIQLFTTL